MTPKRPLVLVGRIEEHPDCPRTPQYQAIWRRLLAPPPPTPAPQPPKLSDPRDP